MTTAIRVLACMLALGAAPGVRAQVPEEPDFTEESEEPLPSPGAPAHDADAPPTPPWKNRWGVLLDGSAPEGVGASALMQPTRWGRVYAGPAMNSLGFGLHAGATFVPLQLLVSPTLDINVSHYFKADYDKLLTQLRGQPSTAATNIRDIGYNQVTARFGLEFSPFRQLTLFGGVGLSYWYLQVNGAESFIEEATENQDITSKPLAIHLFSPALKLGFIVFFN
jgi:hypothetical protein